MMERLGRYTAYLERRIASLGLPETFSRGLRQRYSSVKWRGLEMVLPLSQGRPPRLRVRVDRPQSWGNAPDGILEFYVLPIGAPPFDLEEMLADRDLARSAKHLLKKTGCDWYAVVQPDQNGVLQVITQHIPTEQLSPIFEALGQSPPALDGEIAGVRLELPVGQTGLKGTVGLRIKSEKVPGTVLPFCGEEVIGRLERFRAARPGIEASTRLREWVLEWDGERVSSAAALPAIAAVEDPFASALDHPQAMNLELTTCCPLRCPQCYCHLQAGKYLALETALYWLKEGKRNGVEWVGLSGGETVCYPHLYEVIREASRLGMQADVSLSGYRFDQAVFDRMVAAGVSCICVSLNGPTHKINSKSRDGFDLAVNALALLKENEFPCTEINWVMHSTNADSFPRMLRLAEEYQVKTLTVLSFKPDSRGRLSSLPSSEQMLRVAGQIRSYDGPVDIEVETCYSPMRALVFPDHWARQVPRVSRGCAAGRSTFSVTVDGKLAPCRHLEYEEQADTLRRYWEDSAVLRTLRQADEFPRSPCKECKLLPRCRHCMDINAKLRGELFVGDSACPLAGVPSNMGAV